MNKENMVFEYTRYFRVQPFVSGGTIMRVDNIIVDYDDVSINFQTKEGLSQYNPVTEEILASVLRKIKRGIKTNEEIIDISKWI